MTEVGITLEQLLESRDTRWNRQKNLTAAHPDLTLLCLTIIIPGSVKRNAHSLIAAEAATKAITQALGNTLQLHEEYDLKTGFEAYFMTTETQENAKRLACSIEDGHELGRLFDIDVLSSDVQPISREQIGLSPRRCMLCNHEARFCMRNHTHSTEELLAYIEKLTENYVRRI